MAFAPQADLVAIAGLLALGRVVLVLAAMDAGTAPAGLAAGLLASLAAMRALASLLYGVTATDPPTFLAVAGGLLAVSALAVGLFLVFLRYNP